MSFKTISLTQNKVTIVDASDYDWLMQWKWAYNPQGGYAQCARKKITIGMHRIIMNAVKGQFVDHINGDGLDNRRNNLRICTKKENVRNRKKNKNSRAIFKGMWFENGKWRASIRVDRKAINLGYFETEIDAAITYNAAALKYFGEFARLNVFTEHH